MPFRGHGSRPHPSALPQQLLLPTRQYNKVIYIFFLFFFRSFYTAKRSFGLSRLLLTLLILSFLPLLNPTWPPTPPCPIAQLYRCPHRLPLLLKHELLGKLNSSRSWREKGVRETRSGDGGRTGGEQKVKTRRQEGIGWGDEAAGFSKTYMCKQDLKVCDDSKVVQIMCFWTLSIVLSLSKTIRYIKSPSRPSHSSGG
jgi:hypothetical protein